MAVGYNVATYYATTTWSAAANHSVLMFQLAEEALQDASGIVSSLILIDRNPQKMETLNSTEIVVKSLLYLFLLGGCHNIRLLSKTVKSEPLCSPHRYQVLLPRLQHRLVSTVNHHKNMNQLPSSKLT